ncbi:HAD-IIA family hydrolase [Neotabrizicola sp. VNH66]|uniref:HAD-IIA family hydrolase n=1 Tax=Neotabrizicola sp. VNH66 TaxID=3400918 RepID=UPI003BFD7CF3
MELTLPATAEAAFAHYEAVRPRLPQTDFPPEPQARSTTLEDVADRWDGFILDAFGVLNVGETPIPGAVDRMARLRAMGKKLCILTNAASFPRSEAVSKFRRLGYDFTADEIVASRDVAAAALDGLDPGATWGAIAREGDDFADLPVPAFDLLDGDWDRADAILFLAAARWTPAHQARLIHAMEARPRLLVVANPDIVAPQGTGLSVEPGFWAHHLLDRVPVPAHWFGKPFPEAFAVAAARTGLPPHRLAMVGDTLHTDVLGGRAAGMGTVLVADHGLFAGRDAARFIHESGIVPDAVVATT